MSRGKRRRRRRMEGGGGNDANVFITQRRPWRHRCRRASIVNHIIPMHCCCNK